MTVSTTGGAVPCCNRTSSRDPPLTGSSRRLRSQRRLRLAAALLRGERDEGCEPAGFSGNACRLPARAVREVMEVSPEAGLPAPLCAGEVGPLGRSRVGVRPSEFTTGLLALRPCGTAMGSGNVTVAAFWCFGGNIVTSLISGGIFSGCDKPVCPRLSGSVFISLEVCKSVCGMELSAS